MLIKDIHKSIVLYKNRYKKKQIISAVQLIFAIHKLHKKKKSFLFIFYTIHFDSVNVFLQFKFFTLVIKFNGIFLKCCCCWSFYLNLYLCYSTLFPLYKMLPMYDRIWFLYIKDQEYLSAEKGINNSIHDTCTKKAQKKIKQYWNAYGTTVWTVYRTIMLRHCNMYD